jgi:hypothetical protein
MTWVITLLKHTCALLIVIHVSSISKAQTKYFVANDGSDNNSATIGNPLKTISCALQKARRRSGNVSIEIRNGVYYLNTTLQINADNFLPASLQIKAYQNEQVTISAGRRLVLQWKPYKENIFVAKVPVNLVFERMFVNGKLQILARYPNYDSAARVFHGTSANAIAPERVKRWHHPVGGYIHALHVAEWGSFDYRFTGVDSAGKLQMVGGWQNNRPGIMHPQYRFVENIFEELDTTNEWFLDRQNHLLYYYPPKNLNLKTALIEVSHLKESFLLKGTVGKPLMNIIFSRLHFKDNERTFMQTKEPLLRSDWAIYRGGAIVLDGTENCKIADCVFEGLGGNAILFSRYNKKDTVTGCHIFNIGANAIAFIGDMKAVRSPSFGYENFIPYEQLDKTPGPLTNNYPQQCVVNDNLLHDLGDIEKQATGVEIEVASGIKISHNSIYNVPRAGINIGDGCFGRHLIEYNDVFNTVRETGDHGSFNSWGRDRYWAPNRQYMDSIVALHPELILLDAQNVTIIRNNRWRCDNGWDVDLDDGSSNYDIYNNLFLAGGLKFREGFYRKAENNIMVNNTFHPHVWFKNSGDVFVHNIVMRKYMPIGMKYWGKKIDSNLFPDEEALKLAHHNGTDSNSIAGDPMFINPAKGDFRVRSNSPALKIGFKNFPMDQFGVQKSSLKKIALQPEMPVPVLEKTIENEGSTRNFVRD